MSFLKDLSKGKLLGHPIHVMAVHFPLALFPLSLIFDLITYFTNDTRMAIVSFFSIACGTIGSYLAAFFGIIDLMNISNDDLVIWKKALIHGSVNGLIIFSYTILTALRLKIYPELGIPSFMEIFSNGILNILLIIGAHYGGDLVFRHKVGIIKKENS